MKYYQSLISGKSVFYLLPKPRFNIKIRIILFVWRMVSRFQKKGGQATLQQVDKISTQWKFSFDSEVEEYLFAREMNLFVQRLINLRHRKALCLERASIICGALRLFGLPAQVVIGRKRSMTAIRGFEFHAWVVVSKNYNLQMSALDEMYVVQNRQQIRELLSHSFLVEAQIIDPDRLAKVLKSSRKTATLAIGIVLCCMVEIWLQNLSRNLAKQEVNGGINHLL
ncbi:Transglutaminase-like superfamily protein [Seinonella peptonophila]|uniref:Transglutaminase-like superfamily protein n=1 Tax=Seinonella peptonophila TaxID=112248 RepID=A0A1M4U2Y2_9BACL|nr:transglutaminase-like domain-containing protein [Seinonella peptonophila]SHE51072.1 Transglutaminase-like superfamily protein [Seinonella peptonophila]